MRKSNNIPTKMYALRAYGPRDFRYEITDVPQIKEDEILIKSLGCGICAGDLKSYHGAAVFWGGPNLAPWQIGPVNCGHEFFGEVVAIGDVASKKYKLEIGDWCTPEQIIPCGECRFCKEGEHWMCDVHNIYGFQKDISDGGMADFVRINHNSIVHKLPKSIGVKGGAMVEPVACAAHTIERAQISMRDVVVIAGMGPIGLCKLQFAKMKSPKLVIVIDGKQNRLELAKKLGADVCLDITKDDVVKEVKALTDGYGCDIYIECAGHPSSVVNGLNMIRRHGKFIEFSVFGSEVTADWSIIGDKKELTILGAHIGGHEGYEIAIRAISEGMIAIDDIVTQEFALKDWEEAYELSEKGDASIKVILIPDGQQVG